MTIYNLRSYYFMRKSFLFFIILFLSSCNQKVESQRQQEFILFEPNYHISLDQLLSSGFYKEKDADVFLLKKNINDTTQLTILLDDSTNHVLREEWQINFSEYNVRHLEDFIERNYGNIVTPLCERDSSYTFFVQGGLTDLYFKCYYVNSYMANKVSLQILHDYPHSPRGGLFKSYKRH